MQRQRLPHAAQTVLSRWNITTTLDFGRIVFALIEIGHLQKTEADRLDDFREDGREFNLNLSVGLESS